MNTILDGLRVVEVSAFVAAPYAGLTLAQMGAEVIRIDPPGGGLDYHRWPVNASGRSYYWAGLNKNKRSVCIDTRHPEGRELAHALMTGPGPGGGMVLTNLPARGWLDPAALRRRREDLVMLAITGNPDGSIAVDYTVNAAAGFPFATGGEDSARPVNHMLPAWDLLAGLWAANGLIAAERHRRETGEGQLVRLALSDVAFSVLSHLGIIAEVAVDGVERPRLGNHVYGTFACDFETEDGGRLMVAAVTERHWLALLEVTGLADKVERLAALLERDFRREGDRYEAREVLAALFRPWFARRSLAEARAALDGAGILCGPFQTFSQALAGDARLSVANPMFETVGHPGLGRFLTAGSVLDFGARPRATLTPAHRLGEDTEAVLAERLGLSAGRIGALMDQGIVAGPAR